MEHEAFQLMDALDPRAAAAQRAAVAANAATPHQVSAGAIAGVAVD
jgi:hypothetical protein